MRRQGFTLIELLVVVSIIALLIAILLPSLNRAVQSARLVVCMSDMRQIGHATLNYAAESRGALPDRPVWSRPHQAYVAYYDHPSWTEPDGSMVPWHWAKLHERGYLPEANLMYCPQRHPEGHAAAGYPEPWGSATNKPPFIRVDYLVTPYENYPKSISRFTAGTVLSMEVYWSAVHFGGFNVLWGDGAVGLFGDDNAYAGVNKSSIAVQWSQLHKWRDQVLAAPR